MRKKHFLVALVLLCVAGAAYTVLQNNGHEFTDQQCAECHADTPVKGQRATLKLTAPQRTLCGRCHQAHLDNSISHPSDIVAALAIPPADLPLTYDGKVSCSTCHEIHALSGGMGTAHAKLLRRDAIGVEFCSACHVRDPQSVAGGGHIQNVGIAHMRYSADAKGGKIDKISSMCLGCHDGTVGGSSDVRISSGSWQHGPAMSRYDPQGSHPIGIKYLAAFRRAGGLRAPTSLNPAIKLIEGRVGCPSCHDLYSRERKKLVVANSRLCTECHDK